MRSLILFKPSRNIQLGHLYEHLFCAQIYDFFYRHHLYAYLDYDLDGKTFYGGAVYIEVLLYSEKAQKLAQKIRHLPVNLSDDSMLIAVHQIRAEKDAPLGSHGADKIIASLEKLHEQPWQDIDELESFDANAHRLTPYPLYVAEGDTQPSRTLAISVILDHGFARNHRELIPLFRQISTLISCNLHHRLADVFGYFSSSDTFSTTNKRTIHTNIFKRIRGDNDALVDILHTSIETVQEMYKNDGFTRHMKDLLHVSHLHNLSTAPNLIKNYEDTLQFVGAKGWKNLSTAKNCDDILQQTSIEVRAGSHKVSGRIF